MLKAKGKLEDGRPLLVIGLCHENLRRLKQGKPIKFDLAEVGMFGECLIFSGRTTEEMAGHFAADLVTMTKAGNA